SPVYPRWRGEHFSNLKPVGSLFGLSPLARGTQSNRYFKWPAVRFIPAGAGNSPGDWRNNPDHAVYPRWRGELGWQHNEQNQRQRFIPAGAGNSCFYSSRLAQIAVYPRWRGELSHCLKISSRSIGLSPLARGTHVTRHWTAETTRFIPAGAGNSSSSLPNPSVVTVYPRWRGELHPSSLIAGSRNGLSPLARGTL
ncbi:hypothetical protein A1UI_02985, partial [Escherichia coli KTE73]